MPSCKKGHPLLAEHAGIFCRRKEIQLLPLAVFGSGKPWPSVQELGEAGHRGSCSEQLLEGLQQPLPPPLLALSGAAQRDPGLKRERSTQVPEGFSGDKIGEAATPLACTWLREDGAGLHVGRSGHFLPAVEVILAGSDFRGTRVAPINQLLNNLVDIQNATHQAVHLLVEAFKPVWEGRADQPNSP